MVLVTAADRRSASYGKRLSARAAFTMAEALIVIGIIAVLIAVLIPVVSVARENSRRVACLSNLKTLVACMVAYSNANSFQLPNGNAPLMVKDYDGANRIMTYFNEAYVQTPKVFFCPSSSRSVPTSIVTADPELDNSARVSYDFYCLYWAPADGPNITRLNPNTPLAWDLDGGDPSSPLQNHGNMGGNVAYVDGHADWQDRSVWDGLNWPRGAAEVYPYP